MIKTEGMQIAIRRLYQINRQIEEIDVLIHVLEGGDLRRVDENNFRECEIISSNGRYGFSDHVSMVLALSPHAVEALSSWKGALLMNSDDLLKEMERIARFERTKA